MDEETYFRKLNKRSPQGRFATRQRRMVQQIERWDRELANVKPPFKQCHHLIRKFGGILPFCVASGLTPQWVLYDCIPKHGGLLPMRRLARLILAARYWGVLLTPEDIYPDFIEHGEVKKFSSNKEIRAWLETMPVHTTSKLLEDQIASLVSTLE